LKRREEEKSEEQQAGRSMVVPPHDIGHQVPLVRLLFCFIVINAVAPSVQFMFCDFELMEIKKR